MATNKIKILQHKLKRVLIYTCTHVYAAAGVSSHYKKKKEN